MDAKTKATIKYNREKVRRFSMNLSPVDADMIKWLEGKDNITGYLKQLVRKDMEKHS
jgi:hypothetical protein|nr:MAG TPA: hypothetical protein [Caudoviricetes sp.]